MKVILFGGAEMQLGHFKPQLKLIEQVIKRLNPKQVLLIPFARPKATEIEWEDGWFERNMDIGDIIYLNAKNKKDIEKAENPLIFMSGGGDNLNLLEKINENSKLLKLVKNAEYIIGESAGAKVLGAYFRKKGGDDNSELIKGLDIIKNTIIEPHYTQRNRQGLLVKGMEESGLLYGLGIDAMTAVEFNPSEFPDKYEKIGNGVVEIKINRKH